MPIPEPARRVDAGGAGRSPSAGRVRPEVLFQRQRQTPDRLKQLGAPNLRSAPLDVGPHR